MNEFLPTKLYIQYSILIITNLLPLHQFFLPEYVILIVSSGVLNYTKKLLINSESFMKRYILHAFNSLSFIFSWLCYILIEKFKNILSRVLIVF